MPICISPQLPAFQTLAEENIFARARKIVQYIRISVLFAFLC